MLTYRLYCSVFDWQLSLFWQRKRVCFSNDIQTVEIPRRRAVVSLPSSTSSAADIQHRGIGLRSSSRPVNRQLELPGRVKGQLELGHIKGQLRSPLSGSGPSRVSIQQFLLFISSSKISCLNVQIVVIDFINVGHLYCRQ